MLKGVRRCERLLGVSEGASGCETRVAARNTSATCLVKELWGLGFSCVLQLLVTWAVWLFIFYVKDDGHMKLIDR